MEKTPINISYQRKENEQRTNILEMIEKVFKIKKRIKPSDLNVSNEQSKQMQKRIEQRIFSETDLANVVGGDYASRDAF